MRRNCRTMSYSFTLRPTIRVSLCTTCRDARPHTPPAPAPHPRPAHLLSLDVTLDLGDLDLHGVQLLVQHQGDVGRSLRLVHRLEAEVRERDVPLAVVLLGFAGCGVAGGTLTGCPPSST